ncbi:RsmF rRNA methyltransferase first C-terminal domain-containing protein [Lacrimispora sp. 210928-DFI.3.58]|uniref:RsmF rRNA methyltransferase first C-terminal domain-containing protein n=1 Tax=Lacrimispora sp. 210928-DFI.3.58 TaxID=2883214 RepID=UPI001D067C2F|nr:RsmB/NOP family class I SAM-dependent RNA methyltransferase [Lacrimispora sp. 210928-DFI.3.58]MCB7317906.1 RsmB/NOP family class I SAM-dependent RNA methyltransferase [Lacrimispora sp. 210928-DFI.3.58]
MTDIRQLPEAFLEEMKGLLGEEYQLYRESFKEPWKPGLRVNTQKLSPKELKALVPWKLEPVPWTDNGFYYEPGSACSQPDSPALESDARPSKHPCYYAGLYYLQEASAMTPAAMLPVEPGDMVLDVCAAPGGKSTELAAKLKGEGMLVSNDISYSRARALLKNLELTGAGNICVTSEEPGKLAKIWPLFFDKILVDAPCSGEGMFRRDEDMIKDWEEHGPSYYAPIQREILRQAVSMLKPGGMLLYSTCTFSRMEDEENIEFLLSEYPEMELVPLKLSRVPGGVDGVGLPGCIRLFPHKVRGEGHFLALLRKKGAFRNGAGKARTEAIECADTVNDRKPSEGTLVREALEREECLLRRGKKGGRFLGEAAGKSRKIAPDLKKLPELAAFLDSCAVCWEEARLSVVQDQVYYLPRGLEQGLPLRFLRTGLLLGELKKGRFEPSQALAMALKKGEYPNVLNLPEGDERVLRYLKGETISLQREEGTRKDWCLVTYCGYSLGWAKGNGMTLKNKYYPGWRWQ